jgi:large subunit ribosomal protein L15
MPLLRRIPKRGFNNANFRTVYAIVNIEQLNEFDNGATVTPEALVEAGLAGKLFDGVKVLGNGALKKKLTVKAQKFSASARDKIVQAGGQCEDLPLRSIHHKPVSPPAAAPKAPAGEK